MGLTREWFIYNRTFAGEYDSTNYNYVPFFPVCVATGPYICAVLGLYDPFTYGDHPVPFIFLDTNLYHYISQAKAAQINKPSGPFEKRYVYVTPFT